MMISESYNRRSDTEIVQVRIRVRNERTKRMRVEETGGEWQGHEDGES